MEHYFSLNGITNEFTNLCYSLLYLDQEQWKWWKWNINAHQGYGSWMHLCCPSCMNTLIWTSDHLGHLTKLKQSGIVEYFIASFEHLYLQMEGMKNSFFQEFFISGLKDEFQAHVVMPYP
jgi:hypothetical protein